MLITKDEAQSANFHAFHGGPPHALAGASGNRSSVPDLRRH
jgi:hypothetical protein